jgi:hypothetical protein
MPHETTLIYTEALLRQAAFSFWRRTVGIGFFASLAAVAVCLGVFVAEGDSSWLVGALATVLLMGIAFATALYFVHYRNSMHKFREMGHAQATFRADESSFTISSSIGTSTLQWSAVRELWQFPGVWLLLYSKAQFSTLPLAGMSPDMQAFVAQRVRAAGGKVDRQ